MGEVRATPTGLAVDVEIDKPSFTPPPQAEPAAGDAPTKGFLETVPAEYASKEWVTKLAQHENPLAELVKAYDNQLSLIGRKAEGLKVPAPDAPAEEWTNFNKAIGVPETPDSYEYTPPAVADHLKPYFERDENFLSHMKKAAHEAGIPDRSFQKIAKALDEYQIGQLDSMVTNTNQVLSQLEQKFKGKYGDKSPQVLETWQKSFLDVGQEEADLISQLNPRVKVVLAEHFNNFARKYIKEDTLGLNIPNAGSQVMNQTQYGEEYARLRSTIRSSRPGSPEYLKAQSDLASLRERGAQTVFKQ